MLTDSEIDQSIPNPKNTHNTNSCFHISACVWIQQMSNVVLICEFLLACFQFFARVIAKHNHKNSINLLT